MKQLQLNRNTFQVGFECKRPINNKLRQPSRLTYEGSLLKQNLLNVSRTDLKFFMNITYGSMGGNRNTLYKGDSIHNYTISINGRLTENPIDYTSMKYLIHTGKRISIELQNFYHCFLMSFNTTFFNNIEHHHPIRGHLLNDLKPSEIILKYSSARDYRAFSATIFNAQFAKQIRDRRYCRCIEGIERKINAYKDPSPKFLQPTAINKEIQDAHKNFRQAKYFNHI